MLPAQRKGLPPAFGRNPLPKSGAKRTLLKYLVPGGERQSRLRATIASRNVMVRPGEQPINERRPRLDSGVPTGFRGCNTNSHLILVAACVALACDRVSAVSRYDQQDSPSDPQTPNCPAADRSARARASLGSSCATGSAPFFRLFGRQATPKRFRRNSW